MPIAIPRSLRAGLKSLVDVGDDDFRLFLQALASCKELTSQQGISSIQHDVPNISEADAGQIVQAIVGLAVGQVTLELGAADFVTEILSSESNREFLETVDKQRLQSRLGELLALTCVSINAKAVTLLSENQHVMLGCRIVSDVRPAFEQDLKAKPKVAVLVHHLKLDYLVSGERREFFIALDINDVISLKKMCERAQEKADSMVALLQSAGVTLVQAPPTPPKK